MEKNQRKYEVLYRIREIFRIVKCLSSSGNIKHTTRIQKNDRKNLSFSGFLRGHRRRIAEIKTEIKEAKKFTSPFDIFPRFSNRAPRILSTWHPRKPIPVTNKTGNGRIVPSAKILYETGHGWGICRKWPLKKPEKLRFFRSFFWIRVVCFMFPLELRHFTILIPWNFVYIDHVV